MKLEPATTWSQAVNRVEVDNNKGNTMADLLIVTSKVKGLVKQKDLRTGDEFIEALSAKVRELVEAAIPKAIAAKRKTLKAEDL